MTISTTTSSITYAGNGATTVFTFSFVGVSSSDLEVIYTDAAGVETTLNPSVYSVTINSPPSGGLWGIGGNITYPLSGSPIATGTKLTINRIVPYEQTVTISNQGAFYPQAVEQGLDLLELQIQQIDNGFAYAIQCPIADGTPPTVLPVAALRANGFLGFDSSGQPTIVNTLSLTATPRVVTTTGTATITLTTDDSVSGVSIYQTGPANTTIQLPVGGGPYPIFDGSLNSSTYPITVLPPAGLTVLGNASFTLGDTQGDGASFAFYNDGVQILVL